MDKRKLLIVIPYEGYYSKFANILSLDEDLQTKLSVHVATPPFYFWYKKRNKFITKKEQVLIIFLNFFVFIKWFLFRLRLYSADYVLVADVAVVLPYLLLIKICPFLGPRKKIIIMSFF